MYNIAIAQLAHESGTFSKHLTSIDRFKESALFTGEEIMSFAHSGVKDYVSGMVLESEKHNDIKLIPCFSAYSLPSGTISAACYNELKNRMLETFIKNADNIDAVCIYLHGAGCSENCDDIEGDILTEIRKIIGDNKPIIVPLDLHANVSHTMIKHATSLMPVKLYPHTDCFITGKKAMDLAYKIVSGQVRAYSSVRRLPMLIQLFIGSTSEMPMKRVKDACLEFEKIPGILDCSFNHGFPYGDTTVVCASSCVTATSQELADGVCEKLANMVWENRDEFNRPTISVGEGIARALNSKGSRIVINEISDNPGAGTPGDGTYLLQGMIDHRLKECCFASIVDAETVDIAVKSGVGSEINVMLGGKIDGQHGEPIKVNNAYVKSITDGQVLIKSNMMKGYPTYFGTSVRLVIEGIDVIVCKTPNQIMDDAIFSLHGININEYRYIGLKSAQHFKDYFTPIADNIISVDPPGISTSTLTRLPYKNLPRPIFPLDNI